MRLLSLAAAGFLIAGMIDQICTAGMTYLGANIGWVATNRLRADLVRHCLEQDMPFHHLRTPGEMIERIDGDVMALSNFFSQFLVRVVSSALLLVGVLVMLYRVDLRVGLALTLFAGGAAVILWRMRARLRAWSGSAISCARASAPSSPRRRVCGSPRWAGAIRRPKPRLAVGSRLPCRRKRPHGDPGRHQRDRGHPGQGSRLVRMGAPAA